jgi:hypothetical protein
MANATTHEIGPRMRGDIPHRLNDVANALVSRNLFFGSCVEHPSFMHAKLCEEIMSEKASGRETKFYGHAKVHSSTQELHWWNHSCNYTGKVFRGQYMGLRRAKSPSTCHRLNSRLLQSRNWQQGSGVCRGY